MTWISASRKYNCVFCILCFDRHWRREIQMMWIWKQMNDKVIIIYFLAANIQWRAHECVMSMFLAVICQLTACQLSVFDGWDNMQGWISAAMFECRVSKILLRSSLYLLTGWSLLCGSNKYRYSNHVWHISSKNVHSAVVNSLILIIFLCLNSTLFFYHLVTFFIKPIKIIVVNKWKSLISIITL